MYILLTEHNIVKEIIPTYHPALPGVEIEKRYPVDIVAKLLFVDDSVAVAPNDLYDPDTGTFSLPPEQAQEAVLAPEGTSLSPALLRNQAYDMEATIGWEKDMLTVTQAAALWQYYAAEGSAKADDLSALIAAAKQSIREKYPDEEVSAE